MFSGIATRVAAAAFAIVFALATEAPSFGSPCPVHDPAFARLSTGPGHTRAAAAPTEVADHHSSAQHQHATRGGSGGSGSGDSQHHQKSHGCTCVGCGCSSSPVTLPSILVSLTPAIVSAGTTIALPPIEKHACSIPEHALPFSTAPPSSAPQSLIG